MSAEHAVVVQQGSLPTHPSAALGGSALEGLWGIYYRRGYEDGHKQLLRDVLGALVTISEDFLRARGKGASADEARKLVYAFEHYLERQIESVAGQAGFVEGGLGI